MRLTQSIKEILAKPFLSLLSAVVFLTPLIMSNSTNELFEFPKMFFIYFMGIGIFSLFLTSLVLKKTKVILPSVFVIAFFLSNVLSTVFSTHPYTSILGYYTRFNDGLLSTIIFLALYVVCKNKIKIEEYVLLMKVGALTIFPIGLVGIMQHFGLGSEIVDRVYSTIGQPNWLAQYLVMILPFILYLFIFEVSLFWGFLFIIGFACLWFTYSMSGIIGFVAVTLVFLFVFIYKKSFTKNSFLKFLSIYLICFIIAVSNLGIFKDRIVDTTKDLERAGIRTDTVDVSQSETQKVVETQSVDYKVSDPGFIRFGLWKGSLNLFLSSPKVFLMGVGPETFPYGFQPFRLNSLNYSSEWEFVFNKPHNYYLEVLTELGLLGFIAYLALIFRLIKKLPVYIIPGFVGFLVTNLFGWPVVATSLLFWLWVSWAESN
jgi:putative inorganic carbon (HCO3(-)) transporter